MRLPRKAFRAAAMAAVMAYAVLLGAVPAGASPGGGVGAARAPVARTPRPWTCTCTPSANPSARLVLHHVSYGTVSPYQEVPAGDYTVSMRSAGAPATAQPLLSTGFRGERRPGLHGGRHGGPRPGCGCRCSGTP